MEKKKASVFPKLPPDFQTSDEIRGLGLFNLKKPTAKELKAESKLVYLWGKYGNE